MRLFAEGSQGSYLADCIAGELESLIADYMKANFNYAEIVALQSMPIRITFDYVLGDDGIRDTALVKFETIKEGKIRKH